MTLDNVKRLLAHYEATGNKEAALDMRRKLAFREQNSPDFESSSPKGKKKES